MQRQTLGWLERYELRWDLLIMRDFGDYDASRDFKRRTRGELRPLRLRPAAGLRGRPAQLDMFHAEGVPCVYIHSGYYD